MQRGLFRILVVTALLSISSGARAATLTYQFSGTFTQDGGGGTARNISNGIEFDLPSVTAGQSFQGTLSYSTEQPHSWNVTEHDGSFTLQQFSVSFGGNVLHMGIGPFGMHLQNDVTGIDQVSITGADDTGFALLNSDTVRAVTSISLVDVDGAALNSVVLGMLPELLLFEQRRFQIFIAGYFDPTFSMYNGEIATLTQTPIPGALPLFGSAIIAGAFAFWKKRKRISAA